MCVCVRLWKRMKSSGFHIYRVSLASPLRAVCSPLHSPSPLQKRFLQKKNHLKNTKKHKKPSNVVSFLVFFIVERHFYKEKMVKNTWCACLSFILLLILCVGTIALSLVCSHVHLFSRNCKDQFLTCWHCFWCNGGIVADEGWGSVDIGRQVRGEADRI